MNSTKVWIPLTVILIFSLVNTAILYWELRKQSYHPVKTNIRAEAVLRRKSCPSFYILRFNLSTRYILLYSWKCSIYRTGGSGQNHVYVYEPDYFDETDEDILGSEMFELTTSTRHLTLEFCRCTRTNPAVKFAINIRAQGWFLSQETHTKKRAFVLEIV